MNEKIDGALKTTIAVSLVLVFAGTKLLDLAVILYK